MTARLRARESLKASAVDYPLDCDKGDLQRLLSNDSWKLSGLSDTPQTQENLSANEAGLNFPLESTRELTPLSYIHLFSLPEVPEEIRNISRRR